MKKYSFYEKCYKVLRKVPKGRVTTYKEIAKSLVSRAYRVVGNAMNKNPYAPQVPCHRVVNSDGRIGGFFSGQKNKTQMLKKEGVIVKKGRIENFNKLLYRF